MSYTVSLTLADIIQLTQATLQYPAKSKNSSTEAVGAELLNTNVSGIATLEAADKSQISFLANSKYRSQLSDTQALAVFVSEQDANSCPSIALVVSDPYAAFARVSQLYEYRPEKPTPLIAASAQVHESAQLADDVCIGHNVVIGRDATVAKGAVIGANTVIEDAATIGEGCVISPNVTVHHHCVIGSRVRLHAGCSIGAEGFGFAPVKPQQAGDTFYWQRIAQLGRVVIGDDTRVGANVTIDRGALSDTVIGKGVIIDNLVQVAHNVHIGDYTAIAACTGIAGSTRIGRYCIIGGSVGIAGHLTIADGVQLAGGTKVHQSIKAVGSYASGSVHMPTKQWQRAALNARQLAEYAPRKLASEIETLKTDFQAMLNRLKSD